MLIGKRWNPSSDAQFRAIHCGLRAGVYPEWQENACDKRRAACHCENSLTSGVGETSDSPQREITIHCCCFCLRRKPLINERYSRAGYLRATGIGLASLLAGCAGATNLLAPAAKRSDDHIVCQDDCSGGPGQGGGPPARYILTTGSPTSVAIQNTSDYSTLVSWDCGDSAATISGNQLDYATYLSVGVLVYPDVTVTNTGSPGLPGATVTRNSDGAVILTANEDSVGNLVLTAPQSSSTKTTTCPAPPGGHASGGAQCGIDNDNIWAASIAYGAGIAGLFVPGVDILALVVTLGAAFALKAAINQSRLDHCPS